MRRKNSNQEAELETSLENGDLRLRGNQVDRFSEALSMDLPPYTSNTSIHIHNPDPLHITPKQHDQTFAGQYGEPGERNRLVKGEAGFLTEKNQLLFTSEIFKKRNRNRKKQEHKTSSSDFSEDDSSTSRSIETSSEESDSSERITYSISCPSDDVIRFNVYSPKSDSSEDEIMRAKLESISRNTKKQKFKPRQSGRNDKYEVEQKSSRSKSLDKNKKQKFKQRKADISESSDNENYASKKTKKVKPKQRIGDSSQDNETHPRSRRASSKTKKKKSKRRNIENRNKKGKHAETNTGTVRSKSKSIDPDQISLVIYDKEPFVEIVPTSIYRQNDKQMVANSEQQNTKSIKDRQWSESTLQEKTVALKRPNNDNKLSSMETESPKSLEDKTQLTVLFKNDLMKYPIEPVLSQEITSPTVTPIYRPKEGSSTGNEGLWFRNFVPLNTAEESLSNLSLEPSQNDYVNQISQLQAEQLVNSEGKLPPPYNEITQNQSAVTGISQSDSIAPGKRAVKRLLFETMKNWLILHEAHHTLIKC